VRIVFWPLRDQAMTGSARQRTQTDRCCGIHILALRADCGTSLQVQNQKGSAKKADAQGRDQVFFGVQAQRIAVASPLSQ
jgi:hypothetical protein